MTFEPLWRSVHVACACTAIAGVVGVGLAGWLSMRRSAWREIVEAVLTAPMVLPPTVLGWLLLEGLGRHSSLGRLYEDVVGRPLVFSSVALLVAGTVAALPFVVKASRAAFDDVDPRLIAAASTLGASPSRVFFSVVLPLSHGGIVAGLSVGFARALGDFGVTLLLAGNIPGRTQTASLALYDAVTAGNDDDATRLGRIRGTERLFKGRSRSAPAQLALLFLLTAR
jgi:molybdate transport system permease protein